MQLGIPNIVPVTFRDVPKTSYEDWFSERKKSFVCHNAKKTIDDSEHENASLPDTDNSSTSFTIMPSKENCTKREVREDCKNISQGCCSHNELDYISYPNLDAYVWFVAVCLLLGNLILVGCTLNVFRTTYRTMLTVEQIHNTMLLNFAFSDLLMAVYMCVIAVSVAAVKDHCTDEERNEWAAPYGWSIIAVLNFISSQVSVTTLLIMTSFRLYGIVRPYSRIVTK